MKRILWTTLGFVILFFSIMGGSFIGPTSNMLNTKASWVKTQWTYALRSIYCVVLVAAEAAFTSNYVRKLKEIKKVKIVLGILVTPLL